MQNWPQIDLIRRWCEGAKDLEGDRSAQWRMGWQDSMVNSFNNRHKNGLVPSLLASSQGYNDPHITAAKAEWWRGYRQQLAELDSWLSRSWGDLVLLRWGGPLSDLNAQRDFLLGLPKPEGLVASDIGGLMDDLRTGQWAPFIFRKQLCWDSIDRLRDHSRGDGWMFTVRDGN